MSSLDYTTVSYCIAMYNNNIDIYGNKNKEPNTLSASRNKVSENTNNNNNNNNDNFHISPTSCNTHFASIHSLPQLQFIIKWDLWQKQKAYRREMAQRLTVCMYVRM